ncbi:HlyD family secretion protein [Pedobacter sp.]|uniref:HlyD family secretion protein n=1 Tax=Pedobacter sp. TaxID=1411316 RepID=UPI00396CF796
MNEDKNKYHKNTRTEEVQDIIDKMPTSFGVRVTAIVILVFILLFVFGFLVRYPDVVSGQITINANEAPIKLIANTYGKLRLTGSSSMQEIKEGQVIAYLQNPAEISDIYKVDSLLKGFNTATDVTPMFISNLPIKPSMGELNGKYNTFINSVINLNNFKIDQPLDKQVENLNALLLEQKKSIDISSKRVEMVKHNMDYVGKFYKRDSLLFIKKVISEADLDKTQISYFNAKDSYHNAMNTLVNSTQQMKQTEGKIKELLIQKSEKLSELKIALVSAHNDLLDNIKSWEQKYVFRAPFNGKVQFLKFWVNNQFIQSGESVFTIIPKMGHAMGQVNIPTIGAGKVVVGQEVIVKLDNFPYTEYGTIKGRVNSISLSTNISKTEKGEIETYLVTVDFPDQLKTNYGSSLEVGLDAKGSAEIITKDRRLIERFFDNLKYALKK